MKIGSHSPEHFSPPGGLDEKLRRLQGNRLRSGKTDKAAPFVGGNRPKRRFDRVLVLFVGIDQAILAQQRAQILFADVHLERPQSLTSAVAEPPLPFPGQRRSLRVGSILAALGDLASIPVIDSINSRNTSNAYNRPLVLSIRYFSRQTILGDRNQRYPLT
jgi:hypothetical protein